MARIYSDEEKRTHLDQYRVSGKCKTEYARENEISMAKEFKRNEKYKQKAIRLVTFRIKNRTRKEF